MRLAVDKQNEYAKELVWRLGFADRRRLAHGLLNADQKTEAGIEAQRERVAILKDKLAGHRQRRGARSARRWPTRW